MVFAENLELSTDLIETPTNFRPIDIIFSLPDDLQQFAWQKIRENLIRFDASIPSKNTVPADARIVIACEAAESLPSEVAARNKVTYKNVRNCQEDIAAAAVLTLSQFCPEYRIDDFRLSALASRKLERMQNLTKQSEVIAEILGGSEVKKKLEELPHIELILLTYQQFLTIAPLIQELGIKLNYDRQVNRYNKQIRDFLFSDNSVHEAITKLARRIIIAQWLKDRPRKETRAVAQTTAQVFEMPPEKYARPKVLSNIKGFLTRLLEQEFESERHVENDLHLLFPARQGGTPKSFEEVDIAASYRSYAEGWFCPDTLIHFATQVVNGERYDLLGKKISSGFYSDRTKADWVLAGSIFLENTLLKPTKKFNDVTVNGTKRIIALGKEVKKSREKCLVI